MKSRKAIYLISFLLALTIQLKGQSDILDKANNAFRLLDYPLALSLFKEYNKIETDAEALEKRGLCYFHMNFVNNAEVDFAKSRQLGNDSAELLWYMAQCRQHLFQYDEAAFFYRQYLIKAGETGPFYNKALIEIKNCLYAATNQVQEGESKSLVQGFGNLNSTYDELFPVQSKLFGNRFYFSSNRNKIDFKIYAYTLDDDGSWDSLNTSSEKYNYGKNSFIQDIDGAGSSMIIVEKNPVSQRHEILFTRITNDKELRIPLKEKIFKGAIDFHIANDSCLIFASDQLNGYGGYDLYSSFYSQGQWSTPQNLGPVINGVFDERSPCVSSDLNQVFFSSNRPYSFGGYDLYRFDSGLDIGKAINLGATVNSPGDELHLKLYDDSHMAVFSSDRKSGKGGYDLFFLYRDVNRSFSEKDSLPFKYVAAELRDSRDEGLSPKPLNVSKAERPINIKGTPEQVLTIIYEDSYDLLKGKNKIILDRIIKRLINSSQKLSLMAYTDIYEPGLPEYIHYNCLKRASVISDYLINNGVKAERVCIESMGSGFPLVKYESAGQSLDSLYTLNKRIDLLLYEDGTDTSISHSLSESLNIPDFAQETAFELFELIRDGLYFSVRIAQTDRIFKNAILRLYTDIYIRKESPTLQNDYYIGIYTNLEDARNLINEISKSPGLNPQLIAFYKGRKLEKEDLQKMKNRYPQLEALIN